MKNRSLLTVILIMTFIATCALTSSAQPQPRITQQIDNRTYVTLGGNVRPEATLADNIRGMVANDHPVDHLFLFLQRSPEQEKAVDDYIKQLNDKNSPNFHKWLTPEEFGDKFGVAEADIQQVTNWLQSNGFRINQVYPNRMLIDISGTAGQVANAFHTQLATVQVGDKTNIANLSDPAVPAALAPVIRGFASLNSFRPSPNHMSAAQYTFAGCTSTTAHPIEPGTCYAVTPQDNAVIYNLNPLWTAGYSGQNQTIAVIEDTDVYNYPGDWNTYRSTFGLSGYTQGSFVQLHPNCTDPGTNADDGEAAIDVEVPTGIAPSAAIQLLSCPSGTLTFGGLIALQNMLNNSGPYPGVVSVSYGVCEVANGNGGNAAFYYTYQQAAAQGVSVFTSSGDEGASSCSRNFTAGANYFVTSLGVSGWGGTPYDVSVGGTDFQDVYNAKTGQNGGNPISAYWKATNDGNYGSAKSYIPEIPWNDACASALIAYAVTGSYTTYGASGFCNVSPGNSTAGYLSTAIASGGASNCATGAGGTNANLYLVSQPQCQGYAKPDYQTGAALTGGQAVYGSSTDGVRNVPDVSMFAANGAWAHYEVVCWSDPSYTSDGAAACTGAPSSWAGFGGTSVSAPTMAAIQSLVNQKTNQSWGLPLKYYYQIGQNEYGTAGGSFLGSSCNASGTGGPASGCVFNDVTQGDIDAGCRYNGTTTEHHCYLSGTNGAASTDNVTGATMINGGTGYTSAPTCTIAGPTNSNSYKSPTSTTLWAGGTQATCTASVNGGTTTSTWTVKPTAGAAGISLQWSNNGGTVLCGPYTLTGTTATTLATNLNTWLGTNCSTYVTATRSSSTVTITSKTSGYAGNIITQFGNNGALFQQGYVTITNTVLGQGPNYVSGISIGTAGSGYQPETPITLTGGGGTGAIAIANTTPGTGAQSYQPAYGAAPGYDLATGLGTPNAYNLVYSSVWGPVQQPQTITFPNPGPLTYGTAPVTLTATATSGLQVTYTVISGPATVNGSVLTITGAGNVVVEADQAGDANWLPAPPVQDTIVVNQAVLTVTAQPASKTYGDPNPSFTYTMTGFQGSDNQGNSTTGQPSLTTDATQYSAVGPYTITAALGTLASTNYSFTFVNGTLTINQATLTVTANPQSMTYGDSVPPLTYSMTGFLGSDNQGNSTSGQPNITTTATSTSPVGGYPITAALGTLTSTNYTFTFVNGTLTINQRNASVTPNAASKVYGQSDPAFSGTLTGFLPADGVTATYSRTAGENVGNYTISATLAPPGVLSNYNITYNTANFSITQATLTVTADNKTMRDGDAIPPFTASYSGFVNGDNQSVLSGSPSLTTTYTLNSPPGTYPIIAAQGTLMAQNYTFTFVNGVLTVTPVTAGITTPTKGSTFSGSSVTFAWTKESGATGYQIWLGHTPGTHDIGVVSTPGLTATMNNVPTDGTTVYATLYGYAGTWVVQDTATYTTASIFKAQITSPAKGSTFTSSSVTFTWTAESGASSYQVWVGHSAGAHDIATVSTPGLTATVNGLPVDGSQIYVTLYGLAGSWTVQDSATYTAFTNTKAAITTPTKGSTFTGSKVTFGWTAESGATSYQIWVGNTPGAHDIAVATTSGLSTMVSGLPTDGRTLYVSLYGLAGSWTLQDTATYTAAGVTKAVITMPVKGSTFTDTTVTFGWTAETGATSYQIWVGSTPGGSDLAVRTTSALTSTISGLPNNSQAVYVTLYGLTDSWTVQDTASYIAFGPSR